jgi:hypothetical protein
VIYTFYSYKGGVGRSMALAAVARVLAGRGAKVLVVDFDLEAPGLELYFYEKGRAEAPRSAQGLMDLIFDYRLALSDAAEFCNPRFKTLGNYILAARSVAGTRGGSVDLLTAGSRAPADKQTEYAQRVRNFDWQDFFFNWKGDRFFDWLRQQWQGPNGYDAVLVDSRTGVTEMGGVCTYQLADAAVLLCAPNHQNLQGTRAVAEDFASPAVAALRSMRPLQILAVPARLQEGHEKRETFLTEFEDVMGALALPATLAALKIPLRDLALPYLPELSVDEHQVGDYLDDPTRSKPAYQAFERLADALTLLAPDEDRLAKWRNEALAHWHGHATPHASALKADTSRTSAGFDVFVDHARADNDAVRLLLTRLKGERLNAFVVDQVAQGESWTGAVEQAFTYSANLLVCFGLGASTRLREELLARARRRGPQMRVIPVMLPGADESALRSFGLEERQFIDLRQADSGNALQALVHLLRTPVAREGSNADADADVASASPYPGARPFTEHEAKYFFGRALQVNELASAVSSYAVVLIQGAAGVGKTSLVQAGLLPLLYEGRPRRVPARRVQVLDFDAAPAVESPEWAEPPPDDGADAGLDVIVLDSLDSFARGADVWPLTRRLHLVAQLQSSLGRSRRLVLVARGSLADEDWSRLLAPAPHTAQLHFRLAPMARDELRQAVEQPALLSGHLLEPGLAERLLEALPGSHGELMQLQLALVALWQERRRGWLSNQALDTQGHVAGPYRRHVAPALDNRLLAAAWHAMRRAFTLRDSTGRTWLRSLRWSQLSTLPTLSGPAGVVLRDGLVAAGMLDLYRDSTVAPEGGEVLMVAAAGKALSDYGADTLDETHAALAEWRARLTAGAELWRRSQVPDALLSGPALTEAESHLQGELLAEEREYIQASVAARTVAGRVGFLVSGRQASTAPGASNAVNVVEGGSDMQRLSATPGEDVVALSFANGPTLVLHPADARDLMLAQTDLQREGTQAPATLTLVAQGGWRSLAPWLGDSVPSAVLSAMEVLTGHVGAAPVEPVLAEQVAQVDRGPAPATLRPFVVVPGTAAAGKSSQGAARQAKSSKPAAAPARTPPAPNAQQPLLVLLHGLAVNCELTFGRLWQHMPDLAGRLQDRFGPQVYAFDHPTVSASPLANALALAQACPPGASLHLLAHGRGALVAEALARACARPTLTSEELACFQGDDHAVERHALQALVHTVAQRQLRVERLVRVAGPVRGCTLASQRLGAHLSMLRWALVTAEITVPESLSNLLLAAATWRWSPTQLPGLRAMLPDSATVAWLNHPAPPYPGRLAVLAGDADDVQGWYKTLVADLPRWRDSDLLVQTRSVQGGAARVQGTCTRVERGPGAAHFAWFTQPQSALAVVSALLDDAPAGFVSQLPPAALAPRRATQAKAGVVLLVPGLHANVLPGAGGPGLWPQPQIDGAAGIAAQQARLAAYTEPFIAALARDFAVQPCAYDWRGGLEAASQALAAQMHQALVDGPAQRGPVHLLAHGEGALLLRVLTLQQPALWQRWRAQPGAKVLLLAPAAYGTAWPLRVLSADIESPAPAGTHAGPLLQAPLMRGAWAAQPGLLQMLSGWVPQANDDAESSSAELANAEAWHQAARADEDRAKAALWWHDAPQQTQATAGWGLPTAAALDAAHALHLRLRAQQTGKAQDAWRATLAAQGLCVAGTGPVTAAAFALSTDGLALQGGPGDGVVPDDALPEVNPSAAWQSALTHTQLLADASVGQACAQLLRQGRSALLRPRAVALVHALPTPLPRFRDAGVAAPSDSATAHTLAVRVHAAGLQTLSLPLIVGHAAATRLSDAELALDAALGGAMSRAAQVALYPEAPGTYRVFAGPPPVVVVGLGDSAHLLPQELAYAVRMGVLAWVERQQSASTLLAGPPTLAVALQGMDDTMGLAQAAQAVVRGVLDANDALAKSRMPRVQSLTLAEPYVDRAGDAWRAVRNLADLDEGRIDAESGVETGPGALRRRLDFAQRGLGPVTLRAAAVAAMAGSSALQSLDLTFESRRSRLQAQRSLPQPLLSGTTALPPADVLLSLLVPREALPFMGGNEGTVLDLDLASAALPWEQLQPRQRDSRPWALRCSVLRRLRSNAPPAVRRLRDAAPQALVLASATASGRGHKVASQLRRADMAGRVRSQALGGDARRVVQALLARPCALLHIAAALPGGNPFGIPLGQGTVLSAAEIGVMRDLPEVVFLDATDAGAAALALTPDAYARAARWAESLVTIGVPCVVVGLGAAADAVSAAFTQALYGALLQGRPLDETIALARGAAWEACAAGANDWAAFQCYGRPDWALDTERHRPTPAWPEYEGLATAPELAAVLETLATNAAASQAVGRGNGEMVKTLGELQSRHASKWGAMGAVAEAFGVAWQQAGDLQQAQQWLQRAMMAADGSASLRAAERHAALHLRMAAVDLDARRTKQARQRLGTAQAELQRLVQWQPTLPRLRLAQVAARLELGAALAEQPAAPRKDAMARLREAAAQTAELARSVHAPGSAAAASLQADCELDLWIADWLTNGEGVVTKSALSHWPGRMALEGQVLRAIAGSGLGAAMPALLAQFNAQSLPLSPHNPPWLNEDDADLPWAAERRLRMALTRHASGRTSAEAEAARTLLLRWQSLLHGTASR